MWDLEAGIWGVDGAGMVQCDGYLGPVMEHQPCPVLFLTVYSRALFRHCQGMCTV